MVLQSQGSSNVHVIFISTCIFALSDTDQGHFAPSQQPVSASSSTVDQSTYIRGHYASLVPSQPHTVEQSQLPKRSGTCLNEADHHSILFKQLEKHSPEWRAIGRCLGFLPSKLKIIQAKPLLLDGAPTSWLEEILSQWLCSGTATLETLRDALYEAGLGQTASNLHV